MANSYIFQDVSSPPVPINEGGTGATTKASAQTNLGIHEKIYGASSLYNSNYTGTSTTYTATEDGFLFALQASPAGSTAMVVKINGTDIAVSDYTGSSSSGSNFRGSFAAGFIKSGDTITFQRCTIRILKLKA